MACRSPGRAGPPPGGTPARSSFPLPRRLPSGRSCVHPQGVNESGSTPPPLASTDWSKLRVRASGWIVLGEWPDLERVATAASLHRLLRALADDAPEEERGALVRAAGVV